MNRAEIEAEAENIAESILSRKHYLFRKHADAIIALCDRVREADAQTCDYYSEEDGDIASQAACSIRSQGGQ